MKYVFIIIGLVLVLGGIHAVTDPRPFVSSTGGYRAGPTQAVTFDAETATRFGYVSISVGAVVVLAGLNSRWLVAKADAFAKRYPPTRPKLSNIDQFEGAVPKPMAQPKAPPTRAARGFPRIKRDS